MEITWQGHAQFRLRGREGTVVTDPSQRRSAGAAARAPADVVTVSHDHLGHNQVASVMGTPKVINSPGEYEVKGILITGIPTFHDAEKGKRRGKNTAYLIEIEDLTICHLGDLGHVPTSNEIDQMRNNVDILLIPVGGQSTLDATQAVEVISLIEPKVVIPMHYQVGELDPELDPVEKFLRELGTPAPAPQPRLAIVKSGLGDQMQVVLLEPR